MTYHIHFASKVTPLGDIVEHSICFVVPWEANPAIQLHSKGYLALHCHKARVTETVFLQAACLTDESHGASAGVQKLHFPKLI